MIFVNCTCADPGSGAPVVVVAAPVVVDATDVVVTFTVGGIGGDCVRDEDDLLLHAVSTVTAAHASAAHERRRNAMVNRTLRRDAATWRAVANRDGTPPKQNLIQIVDGAVHRS